MTSDEKQEVSLPQRTSDHVETIEHVKEVNEASTRTESHLDNNLVDLGWRSWLVVLVVIFG